MRGFSTILCSAAIAAVLAFAASGPGAAQQAPAPSAPPGRGAAPRGPIPDGDVNDLIKQLGLVESAKPAKEITPGGWVKPKMMVVAIDRPDRLAWLQPAVPDVKLVGVYQRGTLAENEAEIAPYIADTDALVRATPNSLCTFNNINAAKKLKWIHHNAAGPDNCVDVSPQVKAGKFLFTDSQKLHNDDVSGNAIAMMVSLMRGIDLFVKMDMEKHMKRPAFGERGMTIKGRTLLVVGLGGIGTDIASMGHGLGMKVIATRNSSHEGPDYVDYVGLANELPQMIGKADAVLVAAPLTPDTLHMFNTEMFNRMKRGAIFVDVSREEQFVKPDLIAALKSGQVGGAGVDITNQQMIPDGDPMFDAPNLIIETHGGAPSIPAGGEPDSTSAKIWLVTRENMRRYALGEKMLSVADPARGY